MGRLTSWSGDHGMINPDGDGAPLYVSVADWPRGMPPSVGMRVAFEIVDEDLPEGACARACLVVLSGDEANG